MRLLYTLLVCFVATAVQAQDTVGYRVNPINADKRPFPKADPVIDVAAATVKYKLNSPVLAVGKKFDVSVLEPVFTSSELAGKKLVIVVWDTECNTCIRNMATLNPQLRQLIRENKAALISITPGTKERALEVLRYTPVEHTDMLASARNLISELKVQQFPAVILTDRNHIISLAAAGNDHEFYTLVKTGLRSNL